MTTDSDPREIFDRRLRRIRRDRSVPGFADHAFLRAHMAEEILARLDLVRRSFTRALDLGCADGVLGAALAGRGIAVTSADAGFGFAAAASGVQCDEDRLPFADASFDLIVCAGVLDQVNDLPGALLLARRALTPDGLFLAAFVGASSLPLLRGALLTADIAEGGGVAPRIHPLVDVRAAGDLLGRAGFALPVADGDRFTVRYRDPLRLMHDIRGMAAANILRDRTAPPLGRTRLTTIARSFAEQADADDRLSESVEIVYLTGWAPAPDQPRPAARGSGARSLADVLRPRSA